MTKDELRKDYPWVKVEIECGDGWLPLISALCSRLSWYCDQHNVKRPVVKQIKEKFGALVFYIDSQHWQTTVGKGMYAIIADYEAMSRFVCEYCGTTVGVGWSTGWIRSLCKQCFESKISPRWPNREWKLEHNPMDVVTNLSMAPLKKEE